MGANSSIEWTDHTFNPWIGCTKISVGPQGACVNCYAEVATPVRVMHIGWGPGKPRHRTGPATWALPLKWERDAERFWAEHGRRQRVFCASLADVFDNEVDVQWRADLFGLIRQTPNLNWLLLTKRIGNASAMIEELQEPQKNWWPLSNVWLGATVANQAEVDRDVPKLLATPARVRFLSCEPLLGAIDLTYPDSLFPNGPRTCCDGRECGCMGRPIDPPLIYGIDLVITGGESGSKARPSHPDWYRAIRDDCIAAGVAFHFKQHGEWIEVDADKPTRRVESTDAAYAAESQRCDGFISLDGRFIRSMDGARKDVAYRGLARVGKKQAGRMLDGRTWDEFPNTAE